MTHRAVQHLIGRAIVDKEFRDQLLNSGRKQALAQFDLTDDERKAICSIKARSFEEFASELHDWIETVDGEPRRRPTWLSGIVRGNLFSR